MNVPFSPSLFSLFSDGIEADALDFNAGTLATMGIAARKARLVVP